jgi:glycosyltransferase involved in cell wall biosynthesis
MDNLVTGYLASGEDEWLKYLSILLSNPVIRNEMGKNGKIKATKNFSTNVVKHEYRSVF